MMQMLVAGGLPPLTDGLRSADENNPKGYFEWERAKALKEHPEAIAAGEGKVAKIISALTDNGPLALDENPEVFPQRRFLRRNPRLQRRAGGAEFKGIGGCNLADCRGRPPHQVA
jgi:hypothetical protein